jgi:hypothetical protein
VLPSTRATVTYKLAFGFATTSNVDDLLLTVAPKKKTEELETVMQKPKHHAVQKPKHHAV